MMSCDGTMIGFDTFKEDLAETILNNFPEENARLAVIEFADITADVIFDFDDLSTNSDRAQGIREMTAMGKL